MIHYPFDHKEFVELIMVLILRTPNFLDENGNRVFNRLMGLPEINYPTDEEGWAHCLTIPRVPSIENDQLRQRPFKGLERLRKNKENGIRLCK